jgi:hypothetical protein
MLLKIAPPSRFAHFTRPLAAGQMRQALAGCLEWYYVELFSTRSCLK